MIVGLAISAGSVGLLVNPEAINNFFIQLAQTFTLDDDARGLLNNDELG